MDNLIILEISHDDKASVWCTKDRNEFNSNMAGKLSTWDRRLYEDYEDGKDVAYEAYFFHNAGKNSRVMTVPQAVTYINSVHEHSDLVRHVLIELGILGKNQPWV